MDSAHPSGCLVEGHRAGRPRQDIAKERFEHQQRPDGRAVVAHAGQVLVAELLEIRRIEETGREQFAAVERRTYAIAKRTPEPALEGNGEAHLRPEQHLVRQAPLHRLFQQEFGLAATYLQVGWQACQPFDERMIHQRFADFERMRHARPVDLGVDVADQIGLQVEVLDQGERVSRIRATRVPVEHFPSPVAAEFREQLELYSRARCASFTNDTLWK